jgi:phosphoglycerate dehydrogenase-like enzyme
MQEENYPLVLITHSLPKDWIIKLEGKCNFFTGPADATELDLSLIKMLPTVEGLLSLLTVPVTELILDKAPNLRVVSNMAVGIDNIDINACTQRGIPVGNTPGVLTESTADLTMALILSIARNIPGASLDALEGRWKTWSPTGWLGLEMHGSTIGIVGMGKIGKAVANRALGFGMELLQQSDIISLHAPLTPETRGMINKSTLSLIKPSAILINAARGQLVDTNALVDALRVNKLAATALDVTDPEPLPPSHPLYSYPNCLIVPHIGSATNQTRRRMAELACDNLLAGLKGERLPHCVNPEVYKQYS